MNNKPYRQSLFVTLGLVIFVTVSLIIIIHASYTYKITKQHLIQEMKERSKLSIVSLEKNIANLIASYAVNEYEKLTHAEMERRNDFAIVIEDYNMGVITGKKSYISGKIKNRDGRIINFDSKNALHNKQISEYFYAETYQIADEPGKLLGTISIYISDSEMKNELNQIVLDNIINGIIISILLIATLFITIKIFVLKPFSDIITTIHLKDDDGIPTRLVPTKVPKEIYFLSSSINRMIKTIRQSRKRLEEQKINLHYQAHHDALTGLPNRLLFNDRLQRAIDKSKRHSSKVALLFIDLDHFKEINDSLGHDVGDLILKSITRRLNSVIRQDDSIARFGGDEFTVILEDLANGQDAALLAQKIVNVVAKPILVNKQQLYISSSIGISLFPDDGDSVQNLLKFSDAAMYRAKEEGRNNFQFYSAEMTEIALERVVMETNLRTALKENQLVVYYQPQMNGSNDQLIGMEALVRWQHPTLGLIPPDKFIPLAESTGLIIELDQQVMKTAMLQVAKWRIQGLNPGKLSLNLAMKQLQHKNFTNMMRDMIHQTNCSAKHIELEITESQIMINPEAAIKALTEISEWGIELSIDDFGTGYSSLSYLKKLPINKLKIDQSFVKGLPNDEEDAAITKAIIVLAKTLDLNIIAEGVETEAQKKFLVNNDCSSIQGYFYSKPIPTEEMTGYLKINQAIVDSSAI